MSLKTRPGRTQSGRARRHQLHRRDHLTGFLLTLPWIVGLLVFGFGPILLTAVWSLMDVRLFGDPIWVGLGNYQKVLSDEKLRTASYNTAFFMIFGLPISLLVSFTLALLLRSLGRGGLLFRVVVYLPVVIPGVAAGYLWKWIYEPERGTLNSVLGLLGVQGPGWLFDAAWARPAVLILILWGCGAGVLIYLAALLDVPKDLHEAAKLDGANWFQSIIHIDWPSTLRVTVFQAVMAVIGYLQLFGQPFLLAQQRFQPTAAGPENSLLTISIYIYQQAFVYLDFGYASAIAWVLFLFTLLASLYVIKKGDVDA